MTVIHSSNPKDFDSPHWVGPANSEDYLKTGLFAEPETEPTPADILGFVPLDSSEKSRALKLQEASTHTIGGKETGVAKYLAGIARNKKGGQTRAVSAVVKHELVQPFKSSLNHLNIIDGLEEDVEILGVTVFEDDRYEDQRRDIVASYLEARQVNSGVKPSERVSLRQFLQVASSGELMQLVQETHANLENRARFWRSILQQAGEFYPHVKQLVKSENLEDLIFNR